MRREAKDLYDVTETFTHSLEQARLARGEPAGGIDRKVWELRKSAWAVAAAAAALGLTAGGLALAKRQRKAA